MLDNKIGNISIRCIVLIYISFTIIGRLAQLLSARYRSGRFGARLPRRSNRHSAATAAMFLRSYVAQAPSRGDEPRHSLHASTYYREHNEYLIHYYREHNEVLQFRDIERSFVVCVWRGQ